MEPAAIEQLLVALAVRSLVVVDEAYIEFSGDRRLTTQLARFPNLVVLRTLSKAFGLAGARVGSLIAAPRNRRAACQGDPALFHPAAHHRGRARHAGAGPQLAIQRERVAQIRAERERLRIALANCKPVQKIWPSVANFLLVDFADAELVLGAARDGEAADPRHAQRLAALAAHLGGQP